MATRAKTFDCVKMKREAQEKLRKEYEARRSEFSSYAEFVSSKANESELARAVRAKMSASAKGAG